MLELLDRDVFFQTDLGRLFEGDCIQILKSLPDSSVDTVFADPPFNLKKKYGPNHSDNLSDFEYIEWCKEWIKECIRVLKPGGSFFLYNIPKWNIIFGAHIMQSGLDFRHDIAVDMKNGLPIANKLYPSHYSMLYFTKGKPKTFRKVFVPVDTCRHCSSDIKDYGGKKKFMHEEGLNLTDVWTDITVVRHKKFKTEGREANALSTKLLERVVEISTNPGDTVLDPFGGSGTTFSVCEKKNRRWIGIELDFCKAIKERLENGNVEFHENNDKYAKN